MARANGEGSVYRVRKPDGREVWRCAETLGRDPHTGRLIRVVGEGPTEALARERLYRNRLRREVATGQVSQRALREEDGVVTLDQWFHLWLEQRDVRSSTKAEYRTRYRLHIAPYFGAIPLRLITPVMVQDWAYGTLPKKTKPDGTPLLRETAVRSVFVILSTMLGDAARLRRIEDNPCDQVKTPKRSPANEERKNTIRATKNWVPHHLVKHLEGHQDEARWLLALFALRQSEVLGMTLNQLKWKSPKKDSFLVIDKQLARHVRLHGCGTDPRTGAYLCGEQSDRCPQGYGESGLYLSRDLKTEKSRRAIPIVEPLYSALRRQEKWVREVVHKSPDYDPLPGMEDLLFPQANGRPRRHQNDRRAFSKLLDEAKVPDRLRVHDARHLAISMMMSGKLGVVPSQQGILMWTGWSPTTYARMLETYSAQGADILLEPLTAFGVNLTERRDAKKKPKKGAEPAEVVPSSTDPLTAEELKVLQSLVSRLSAAGAVVAEEE
ncbi:site-specific integrase [Nocardioides massiliensis]|uniref:Integrase n=1 Tax=Nocardioides massiliensis TaxID=1325935 RepID=A0ABT9NKY6_9ACTN|nr:site-specific integrase [Nocardioides massiliensis]MDP9821074.1 integrase [Nocardioides massiliensis]